MDYILSDYVRRLRSNKNQLYKDLKPKDRIVKIIENHILPDVAYLGYTFVKTRMQLERNVGDFKQIIWFRTNRKNCRDEVVEFAIHLKTENLEYAKIRKSYNYAPDYFYHNDHSNLAFIAESIEYLDEWVQERVEYWYTLHLDDNIKIIEEIIRNIKSTSLTFLDMNSDFKSSLEYRFNKFINLDYFGFLWVPDILILSKLIDNKEIQMETIKRYNSQLMTEEAKKDIKDEVEIYKIIDNIKNLL